jgi:release factor glutamine methyltransferase
MEISYAGLTLRIPNDVYLPAEDSYMLSAAASSLRGQVLEIGCGCGISSLFCALSDPLNSVLGADINPSAVAAAADNARLNGIKNASFIQSDLFDKIQEKKFDAIMFNPPYLPTSDEERLEGGINKAFDGGEDGRETLDPFLSSFDRYLRPQGTLLLVQSSLNNMEETENRLSSLGYIFSIEAREKFFFESLSLFRATRP